MKPSRLLEHRLSEREQFSDSRAASSRASTASTVLDPVTP